MGKEHNQLLCSSVDAHGRVHIEHVHVHIVSVALTLSSTTCTSITVHSVCMCILVHMVYVLVCVGAYTHYREACLWQTSLWLITLTHITGQLDTCQCIWQHVAC